MDNNELLYGEQYANSLDDYFAKLTDDDVPSRILHPPQFVRSVAGHYPGAADDPPLTRGVWRHIYFDLQRGSRYGLPFPALEDVDETLTSFGDEIPIAILDLRYHAVRLTASAHFLNADRRETAPPPEPSRILEERRVFAAAPLRDATARGQSVTFRIGLPDAPCNIDSPLESVEIDCGDGAGWRPAELGSTVTASYAEPGEKTIGIRALRGDDLLQTRFVFEVESVTTPIYDRSWTQRSDWPYQDQYGSANVYVWYATGKTEITKPIVISEGFDPQNEMTWDRLYAFLGDLAKKLRDGGYDLVIVDFTKGGDHLQRNGLAFATAIVRTVTERKGKEPLSVLGVSMGGLIARYALCALESKGIVHEVARYISFDSPHEGANIPLAIQYFGDYFQDQSAGAKDLVVRVLNSPAARQMLRYHYDWGGDEHVKADPMRAVFLNDLAAVGDWPKIRCVAISNGRADKVDQGFGDFELMIDWGQDTSWAILYFLPAFHATKGQRIFEGFYCGKVRWERWVRSCLPYDRAPGGWRRTVKQVADALKALNKGPVKNTWWHHCFVPTTSALAVEEKYLMDAITPAHVTKFKAYWTEPENTGHVEITKTVVKFVLDELGIPADD